MKIDELKRMHRYLGTEDGEVHRLEDVVLVKCDDQLRPFGIARTLPDEKVTRDHVQITLTGDELGLIALAHTSRTYGHSGTIKQQIRNGCSAAAMNHVFKSCRSKTSCEHERCNTARAIAEAIVVLQ